MCVCGGGVAPEFLKKPIAADNFPGVGGTGFSHGPFDYIFDCIAIVAIIMFRRLQTCLLLW